MLFFSPIIIIIKTPLVTILLFYSKLIKQPIISSQTKHHTFCYFIFTKKKMMKMTSPLMIILLCIQCAVMVASEGGPRVFKVGDEFEWRVPLQNDTAVYSRWASTNRFHIGDSLSFVYDKDSVMEVDKQGFYHCNASDSITAFDNGNSTFILDRPGLFYFISGSNAHCTSGQRLIVEVMHIHHHHNRDVSFPPSMSPLSANSPSESGFDSGSDPAPSAASSLLAYLFLPFAALIVALFCCQP